MISSESKIMGAIDEQGGNIVKFYLKKNDLRHSKELYVNSVC